MVMIYNDFQDLRLSSLGMGAMRLPVADGDDSKIDESAAMALSHRTEKKRAYSPSWFFSSRKLRRHEAVFGSIWKGYGILPDTAELS